MISSDLRLYVRNYLLRRVWCVCVFFAWRQLLQARVHLAKLQVNRLLSNIYMLVAWFSWRIARLYVWNRTMRWSCYQIWDCDRWVLRLTINSVVTSLSVTETTWLHSCTSTHVIPYLSYYFLHFSWLWIIVHPVFDPILGKNQWNAIVYRSVSVGDVPCENHAKMIVS